MNWSTTAPSRTAKTAGMDWTRKLSDTAGLSSTLTLTSSTCPSVSATTCSRIGPRVLHGPHHGAHRSTTTGTSKDRLRTASSNVASVTSTMVCDDTGRPAGDRPPGRDRPGAGGSVGAWMQHPTPPPPPISPPSRASTADRSPTWLADNVAGSVAPYGFELIAGGRSNLTYRVTDAAGHAYALRRPPVSHVLATAHDMAREHTVISALQSTDVPVPRTLGLCVDTDGQRRPVLRDVVRGRATSCATSRRRPRCPRPSGPTPASRWSTPWPRLHAVDVDAVGLGDFARREGYIARQLKRWHGQFEQSTLDGVPGPAVIDRAWEELSAKIPEQQGVAIVHGDYRLDNTVLDDNGDVIGHPRLGDLHARRPAGRPRPAARLLGRGRGHPVARCSAWRRRPCRASPPGPSWSSGTPRPAASTSPTVPYYCAFGIWKLACILQGVYVRYVGGAAAGDRSGVDQFADTVVRLGERALADVEAL